MSGAMITASNYAAQAERDLKLLSNNYGDAADSVLIEEFAEHIGKAVHFVLPDSGRILNDRLRGIDGLEVNCPYRSMTIEFFLNGEKNLALVQQLTSSIHVTGCLFLDGKWFPHPLTMVLKNKWDSTDTPEGHMHYKAYSQKPDSVSFVALGCYANFDTLYKGINTKSKDIDLKKYAINKLSKFSRALFELIEALSCRNVETTPIRKIDQFLNSRRIKDGKLPFYETKMLVINTRYTSDGKVSDGSRSHASPRQHLRRGHIRRLESGNIWVNSCVVGDPKRGIINKRYSVV